MKDFSNEPLSVAEIRATKINDCSKWTPRDVLVSTLRALDAGEINPDMLIIVYKQEFAEDRTKVSSVVSSPNFIAAVGALELARHDLCVSGA